MSEAKVALVTGASGGIGQAVAGVLAEAGYDLALHFRSDHAGVETAAAAVAAAGRRGVPIQADLATGAGVEALFQGFDRAFGRLDVVVSNAGVVDVPCRIDAMTPDRLRRMFDLNLTQAFLVAGAAVRRMSTAKGGTGGVIVNISSIAARLGSANQYADYAAAKAGVDVLTKALSDEVAAEGIRVVGIRPGVIDTPIHGKGGLPDRAARVGATAPLGRAGTAAEVAATVAFLVSDGAGYITGTSVDMTGGR